jgi:hypothetical protein
MPIITMNPLQTTPPNSTAGKSAAEVAAVVKEVTDRQLRLSDVRISNQLYCTCLKSAPDLNNNLDQKKERA